MNNSLFTGDLVRLSVEDPKTMAEVFSRWSRDSEYVRLLDNEPAYPYSQKRCTEWFEKELTPSDKGFFFTIRPLETDQQIGFLGLWDINWAQRNSFVAIGLGERDYWGKGYGTDAMRVLLRFAFTELNLHRVSLGVFGYNERAFHSYEKAGFKPEGRLRQHIKRDGKRWDLIFMGISELWRLLNSDPMVLTSANIYQKWLERIFMSEQDSTIQFGIHITSTDRLVGMIGLDGIDWIHGNAYVGIGIGDRNDWGKGMGTDAMRVLLRYAFYELNLHRISLTVFGYNPRAIRSYEKIGFREEGRAREYLHRAGKRWDMIYMGILKKEWLNTESRG
jgi:RimJ/RimL family protein N-acetyltransferase